MDKVHGNLSGLRPAQKKALENLYRRRIEPGRIGSPELARNLAELSHDVRREVGVLIDRRGRVISVSVADARGTEFPDLRLGENRLAGFHLLHAHPRGGALSKGDLSTLFLKRLDAVSAIEVGNDGRPGLVHTAHLTPPGTVGEEEDWRILPPAQPFEIDEFDLGAQVSALEEEIARAARTREAKKDHERALLVQIDGGEFDAEERLEELGELARTAGAEVVYKELIYRRNLKPGTLVGAGKLEELTSKAYHLDADLLIFGQELGPAQAREIEAATGLKVVDRTQLILDIFALHAQGVESRLQVELAQLRYMKPRLLGAGAQLSRIGGGGGSAGGGAIGTRGPGETKLELDRRRINDRLSFLEKQLEGVSQRREERRKSRERNDVPVVSIVGYTNAGKSTLLNSFTHAAEEPRRVLAENKLFATLRPTSRQGYIEGIGQVIFTDTVGFIRDLPKDLSRAFRSTLEEIGDADVLLHVVDAASPGAEQRLDAVNRILDDLGFRDMPTVVALNKADRAEPEVLAREQERTGGIPVSALKNIGLTELKEALGDAVASVQRAELARQEEARAARVEWR
ncbi:GTPase HflX [Deinococcus radiodurans]|uniref:GTPase HflX n=2 Tax=Deinococcus radiodurans TaxID=1299 RepID=UPI000489BAAA|nr:GTPase HflX [Deinococcus radiodurans]ANC72577.1 GTPase HflX [Deinococcus radiodurans R1 = ATCC 13939 = DSM 20539]QIP30066.1 GTPase HflX [Deinococcus radiodurans]QIP33152.1 GTPase HflX [Deinococcus radiodurans]UTA51953.1 GTPase HflX [Deinococcus radiodurans]